MAGHAIDVTISTEHAAEPFVAPPQRLVPVQQAHRPAEAKDRGEQEVNHHVVV